jgi:hypothetical protein
MFHCGVLLPGESVACAEIVIVLEILLVMLKDIREQLQKRWQIRSLCNILDQLLYHQNPFRLREVSFHILLVLLDAIGDEAILISVLANAISFLPFCDKDANLRLDSFLRQKSKAAVLAAQTSGQVLNFHNAVGGSSCTLLFLVTS